MTTNLPVDETNNSNPPSMATHLKTLQERGVLHYVLEVKIHETGGGVSTRQILLPTSMPILPRLQPVFDDTLKFGPLIRSQLAPGEVAHFFLVNLAHHRIAGCVSLDIADLSDRDLAWIN